MDASAKCECARCKLFRRLRLCNCALIILNVAFESGVFRACSEILRQYEDEKHKKRHTKEIGIKNQEVKHLFMYCHVAVLYSLRSQRIQLDGARWPRCSRRWNEEAAVATGEIAKM